MGELETINNSIAALDTDLKGLTSLQMQTTAKTKTGNNSKSSTNTKATQHESPPTPSQPPSSTPPPPPPKPSLTPSQRNISPNPKDTDILDKGKDNIYVIMDSNRMFINFKELLAGEFNNKLTPIVIPCGNIRKAESILNSTQISTPHIILLHIGINDLDDQRPKDTALKLKELSESFQNKFNCEDFISGVTPRGDHYQNHVHEVNNRLKLLLSSSTVKLITHKNLNPPHLHDDRHLQYNKNQGESTSGVQLLAKNLFEALTKKSLHPSKFDKILLYTKDPVQTL